VHHKKAPDDAGASSSSLKNKEIEVFCSLAGSFFERRMDLEAIFVT